MRVSLQLPPLYCRLGAGNHLHTYPRAASRVDTLLATAVEPSHRNTKHMDFTTRSREDCNG